MSAPGSAPSGLPSTDKNGSYVGFGISVILFFCFLFFSSFDFKREKHYVVLCRANSADVPAWAILFDSSDDDDFKPNEGSSEVCV